MGELRSDGKYRNRRAWARQQISFLLLLCVTIVNGTPQSEHLAKMTLMAQNNDNHNHKPIFVNCSNYAPELNEEEPRGTVVFQVQAEDRDPLEEGGTITYSLASLPGEKLKFEIDNTTGLIKTTWIFDRDEPTRDKAEYLTVLATDNGKPQLKAFCTFKITIKDINDNAPIFDKITYVESVPQDLAPGREVMRVSATDIDDDKNSLVIYSLIPKDLNDADYFYIDSNNGIIYLNKTIDRNPDYKFIMTAKAEDRGDDPKASTIDLDIRVVESHKKLPSFVSKPHEPIKLLENYNNFDESIARLEALSNLGDNQDLIFQLISGQTERTNKANNFRLEFKENIADIKLAKPLDYETNTEYTLIVRVEDKYNLAAETVVNIKILDVNDNIPEFIEMEEISVMENEVPGVSVVQVQAIDRDGTTEHNQVTYELVNSKDLFAIDKHTGNVTTLTTFDRENRDAYIVKVIAMDNSPSAIFKTGEHNKAVKVFRIEIADTNDNPPRFTKPIYIAKSIHEDVNINALVTEVEALDADTTSQVTYSIVAGNTNESFKIEDKTGKILVNKPLDYEKTTEYNLTVRAFDGLFNDTTQVKIFIENVNDNSPVFDDFERNLTIKEESLLNGCIATIAAYDPDIKDPNVDQHIVYTIFKDDQEAFIEIDKNGCITLKKPLDRDEPYGYPIWTIMVMARDDDGSETALRTTVTLNITIIDKNDNATSLDTR